MSRYLRAIASAWLTLMGYGAMALAIGGIFVMVGMVAHAALGVDKGAVAVACFIATLVTVGAIVVELRAPAQSKEGGR